MPRKSQEQASTATEGSRPVRRASTVSRRTDSGSVIQSYGKRSKEKDDEPKSPPASCGKKGEDGSPKVKRARGLANAEPERKECEKEGLEETMTGSGTRPAVRTDGKVDADSGNVVNADSRLGGSERAAGAAGDGSGRAAGEAEGGFGTDSGASGSESEKEDAADLPSSATQTSEDRKERAKRMDRERKRRTRDAQRAELNNASAQKGSSMQALVDVCAAAVTAVIEYVSPSKIPNWSSHDACRMILAACDQDVLNFLERLGESATRTETQASDSRHHMRPDDQFFEALAKKFNDANFSAAMPWIGDPHIKFKEEHRLKKRRDPDFLRTKWWVLLGLYEDAMKMFNRSGNAAGECYCLCRAEGFYTTSGYTTSVIMKEDAYDGNASWHARPNHVRLVQRARPPACPSGPPGACSGPI